MKNSNKGFTLIEIVMVLVLLGILAAVAVPKYYDLQNEAREQTAKTVGAEYQARLNAFFAQELLGGKTCDTARQNAITEANLLKNDLTDFTFTDIVNTTKTSTVDLVIQDKNTKTTYPPVKVAVPACAGDTKPVS